MWHRNFGRAAAASVREKGATSGFQGRRRCGFSTLAQCAAAQRTALHVNRHPSARRIRRSGNLINVSQSRLEELLKAELSYMGKGSYSVITLGSILEHRAPEDLGQLAVVIQRELPLRFATRVRQIEESTPEWQDVPELVELHATILTSFRRLRLVEVSPSNLEPFTEVVRDVQERHMRNLVPMVAKAATALKARQVMGDADLNAWVGKFMNSRLGSAMLLKHYEALLTDPDKNHIGIVDMRCDPAQVCRNAVEHVRVHFGRPNLKVNLQVADQSIEFSFIASVLFNMVVEVLLNGVRATEAAGFWADKAPGDIDILVCANPNQVAIQISDTGGGIPCRLQSRIWEYMFSAAPAQGAGEGLPSLHTICALPDEHRADVTEPGMGLPLCRLYARYLGGSFDLMTMPGVGTDAYIYLNRIDAGNATKTPVS